MATFETELKNLAEKSKTLNLSEVERDKVKEAIQKAKGYISERAKYCKKRDNEAESWLTMSTETRDSLLKTQKELMKALATLPEVLDNEVDRLGSLLLKDMRAIIPIRNDRQGIRAEGITAFSAVRNASCDYYGRRVRRIAESFPKGMENCQSAGEFRKKFLPKLVDDSIWREAAVNGWIHLAFTGRSFQGVNIPLQIKTMCLRLAYFFAVADKAVCIDLMKACTVFGDGEINSRLFLYGLKDLSFCGTYYDYSVLKDPEKLAGLAALNFHFYSLFPALLDLSMDDFMNYSSTDLATGMGRRTRNPVTNYGLLLDLCMWDSLKTKMKSWNERFPDRSPCQKCLTSLLKEIDKLMEERKPLMERFRNLPVWQFGCKASEGVKLTDDRYTPRETAHRLSDQSRKIADKVKELEKLLTEEKDLPQNEKKKLVGLLSDITFFASFCAPGNKGCTDGKIGEHTFRDTHGREQSRDRERERERASDRYNGYTERDRDGYRDGDEYGAKDRYRGRHRIRGGYRDGDEYGAKDRYRGGHRIRGGYRDGDEYGDKDRYRGGHRIRGGYRDSYRDEQNFHSDFRSRRGFGFNDQRNRIPMQFTHKDSNFSPNYQTQHTSGQTNIDIRPTLQQIQPYCPTELRGQAEPSLFKIAPQYHDPNRTNSRFTEFFNKETQSTDHANNWNPLKNRGTVP